MKMMSILKRAALLSVVLTFGGMCAKEATNPSLDQVITRALHTVSGEIAADGSVTSATPTNSFTIFKLPSAGQYVVIPSFPYNFMLPPAVTVDATDAGKTAVVGVVYASHFIVTTTDDTTSLPADSAFDFDATGV